MSDFQGHLLFSYPGSKWNLGKRYVELFPPHKTFVDVFGGSGAMIARKSPSEVEVFNDLDADVINVFRVIQSRQFHELVRLVEGTRNTRPQYDVCRPILDNPNESAVRRAWAFIACGFIGFSIHPCGTRSYANSPKAASRLKKCPKWLAEWRKRLANVVIENEPWQAIVAKYDAEDTLFMLDPPYMPGVLREGKKSYYQHVFSTEEHIELLDMLQQVQGNVLLCGYHHPAYLRRLWHWRNEGFSVRKALIGNRSAREEQVWLNYDADGKRVIDNRPWLADQFLALAGWGDCDDALILIDLLKEITQLGKGANPTFSTGNENSPWLKYAENGSQSLDNRLWIGKRFIEALGGFDAARRMLTAANCPPEEATTTIRQKVRPGGKATNT